MNETKGCSNGRISFRLKRQLRPRLTRVVKVSRRTITSIVEECLEEKLPELERLYLHQGGKAA